MTAALFALAYLVGAAVTVALMRGVIVEAAQRGRNYTPMQSGIDACIVALLWPLAVLGLAGARGLHLLGKWLEKP